jgi:Tol biopolymer transport system component
MSTTACPRPSFPGLLGWLCFGTLAGPLASGQGYKLSAPMPLGAVAGDVTAIEVDPTGQRLAYLADEDVDELFELFVVAAAGGSEAVKVSGALQPGRQVKDFRFTPDGSRVLFLADLETYQLDQLYSAPVDGSTPPVRVSAGIEGAGLAGDVRDFAVSPDSADAAFVADPEGDGGFELYSGLVAGGEPAAQLTALGAGGIVLSELPGHGGLQFDGRGQVLFLATNQALGLNRLQLHRAALDGSQPASLLNPPLVAGGRVFDVQVVPGGLSAVYVADQETRDVQEIYAVPTDGSELPRKLNTAVPAFVTRLSLDFKITPDGARAIVRADGDQLYTVPVDGSGPPLLYGSGQGTHGSYAITADSQRVVFLARLGSPRNELFSAPTDHSSPPIRLHAPLTQDVTDFALAGNRLAFRHAYQQLYAAPVDVAESATLLATPVSQHSFALSADGEHVLYRGQQGNEIGDRLRAVRWDGSQAPFLVHGNLSLSSAVTEFRVSPTEPRVFWRADPQDDVVELFSTPIAPDQPDARLNGSFQREIAGDVVEMQVSADGRHAVYLADQDTNETFALYSVSTDGSAPPRRISPSPIQSVYDFEVDGESDLVLMAVQTIPVRQSLRAVHLDSGAPALNLTPGLPTTAGVGSARLVPGGALALYVSDAERDEYYELFVVPTDGSAAPSKRSGEIEGPLPSFSWRGVRDHVLSPDRTRVMYLSDQEPGSMQVYSVPLDGSSPALRISPPEVTNAGIQLLRFSPDSRRALFFAYLGTASDNYARNDLYSAPVDGGPGAVRLNSTLVANGSVLNAVFTDDSTQVLYLADQEVDGRAELYRVPSDGSAAPVKLNPPLAPVQGARVLNHFEITPDGATVVFAAQLDADFPGELLRVRLAGGPATMLVDPGGANGVIDFELTADSQRALCLLQDGFEEPTGLYLVRLDGSEPPFRIHPPLPDFADVSFGPRITPDGRQVLYQADAEVDGASDLYAVPLCGGQPKKLDGTLTFEGDVLDHALGRSGLVVYRADQDTNGVLELYASFLVRPHRAR